MEKSDKEKEFSALIGKAEQAVSVVKDPQIKQIAFKEILRHLLRNEGQAEYGEPADRSRKKVRKTGSTIRTKGEGPMAWLVELKEEGFFKKPKNISEILKALSERGHHLKANDLTWQLQQCAQDKILRRKKSPSPEGGRQKWHYSNW